MKSIKFSLLLFVCFLSLIGSALAQVNEKKQPDVWENPKLSPTQRWETKINYEYDTFFNDKSIPTQEMEIYTNDCIEKYYAKLDLFIIYSVQGFWKANNRPPKNFNELLNTVFVNPQDKLEYKVTSLLNPLSQKPLKSVPVTDPSPGDISYLRFKSDNGVENVSIVYWNRSIDPMDLKLLKLIEENGGLIRFIHRNELFGHDFSRTMRFIFYSIEYEQHWCQLPGQSVLSTNDKQNILNTYWGHLLDGYQGNTQNKWNNFFADSIFMPLDEYLRNSNYFSKYCNPKLTPEQRWQFIVEELNSKQPDTYLQKIKQEIKEDYLLKLDYAFYFGTKQFAKQYNKIPNNLEQLFRSNLNISGKDVKIGCPQNLYFSRPLHQTPLDTPAPGDITYLTDNPLTPRLAMAFVWSQAPDNEELRWMKLIEKNIGFLNFCFDSKRDRFKIPGERIFLNYSNSLDRVYYFYFTDEGKFKFNE